MCSEYNMDDPELIEDSVLMFGLVPGPFFSANNDCPLCRGSYMGPVDCFHPSGATGAPYMPSTAGGAQTSGQASLRVQPTPQPSAPPAPQQDMSKTTMAGHNYVAPQNQTPQARPQYQNFQFRPTQHGTRPNTHPRQQQPFMPSGTAATTAPMMYPIVFQPTPMGMQTFQQPRSNAPGYFNFMPQYISYSNPANHTPAYYYSNSQSLPTSNLQGNAPGGRNNPTTLVGPQGTPATPTAPTASLSHSQGPAHMHQAIPGLRLPLQPTKRPSYRLAIINPVTQQDIFSELGSNDNQNVSGDSSGRQTPQQEQQQQPTHSIAEEFTRMVNEVANQPSAEKPKSNDVPITSSNLNSQPQTNAITSNNNNIVKSEIINENKNLGPDVVIQPIETPVVSAISDSPVIVPKLPKQLQKNSEQIQSVVLDTNKNSGNKQQNKLQKNKPLVPQVEDIEKPAENISLVPQEPPSAAVAQTQSAAGQWVAVGVPTMEPCPAPVSMLAPAPAPMPAPPPVPSATPALAPQPQRVRDNRQRLRSEEKEKVKDKEVQDKFAAHKQNGPTPSALTSSGDSLQEVINPPTSHSSHPVESVKKQQVFKRYSIPVETVSTSDETIVDCAKNSELIISELAPTATELLSASIEKVAKEQTFMPETITESRETTTSVIEAQAKLTQSLSSCIRSNQTESKMKDINLNNETMDPDTANGNSTEITKTETAIEDLNKNDKLVKVNKNKKSASKMVNNDVIVKETESYENGKDETDKVSSIEPEIVLPKNEEDLVKPEPTEIVESAPTPTVFTPKYKYSDDQWSPLNKSGKKCYDIGLLKQIKDDPMSKNKPNVPLLEACNIIRTAPMQETLTFSAISRPMNDSLFPSFAKGTGMGARSNIPRDAKKDGRILTPSGKGSIKLAPTQGGNSSQKQVIHVTLSLRDEVKLNQVDSAWKPSRFRRDNVTEEDAKTQELYKQFRGILNKLTPQKFDTLVDRVKHLDINNQKRLEGVIDLMFEKAIDEPNFSEAYAAMCNKLSILKVPADSNPDQCVNFRALIISRCQTQFETDKVDEQVLKLEKELADCTDSNKKKELQLILNEENRRARMRSVGNVRFIGELYKLKMLTSKIMVYCMKNLIETLEEEKLECLCKLLTTIGEQVESEMREPLDAVFKKMQDIVERKNSKISSRVRFMIQDVIELRRRKWVIKSVVDSQPKMMDQIQKEAEQQQRHIELMNAAPMGGFRGRDEGGRGKRGGDGRRQNNNNFMDNNSNNWKPPRNSYTVDTSKLKAAGAATPKNLSAIKLAPPTGWTHGSGTKNTAQASSNSMISLTKTNMYSVLENVQADPTSLRGIFSGNKDITPGYHSKGASIERSTFNSRADFSNSGSGSRSGSVGVGRSNSGRRSTSATPVTPPVVDSPAPPLATVPQEALPDAKKNSVKSTIGLCLINRDDDEMVADIKQLFPPQYHAAVVTEILNIALEKAAKEVAILAKSLLHLVSTNTISAENFVSGLKEIFELAPDLYIDIPMLYEYLGMFISPQIEKKHITFKQTHALSHTIILSNHGHLLLKAIIKDLKESMGPTFVTSKWQESGLQLKDWMSEDQVAVWVQENKLEFLEGGSKDCEEQEKVLTPAEAQKKLLQLMNSDESCDCIKGWVQDNLAKSLNEGWFMRSLIQAICEHALFGPEGRDAPRFNQERMNKYAGIINDFGETKQAREASCLFGIQQLIRRLEHPQGLTLEIFQYLHEQYIITVDGFIAWEMSEKEPEGKGVMMKALTSFFTNIKEADNEDSCSED